MSKIKRYHWNGDEIRNGDLVKFVDHDAVIGQLTNEKCRWFLRAGEYLKRAQESEAEIARLRAELDNAAAAAVANMSLACQKEREADALRGMYEWLKKQTPYRFGKIQAACVIDAADTLYFKSDEFDKQVKEAMGADA